MRSKERRHEVDGEAFQYPFYTERFMALLKTLYEITKDSVVKAVIRPKHLKSPSNLFVIQIPWCLS